MKKIFQEAAEVGGKFVARRLTQTVAHELPTISPQLTRTLEHQMGAHLKQVEQRAFKIAQESTQKHLKQTMERGGELAMESQIPEAQLKKIIEDSWKKATESMVAEQQAAAAAEQTTTQKVVSTVLKEGRSYGSKMKDNAKVAAKVMIPLGGIYGASVAMQKDTAHAEHVLGTVDDFESLISSTTLKGKDPHAALPEQRLEDEHMSITNTGLDIEQQAAENLAAFRKYIKNTSAPQEAAHETIDDVARRNPEEASQIILAAKMVEMEMQKLQKNSDYVRQLEKARDATLIDIGAHSDKIESASKQKDATKTGAHTLPGGQVVAAAVTAILGPEKAAVLAYVVNNLTSGAFLKDFGSKAASEVVGRSLETVGDNIIQTGMEVNEKNRLLINLARSVAGRDDLLVGQDREAFEEVRKMQEDMEKKTLEVIQKDEEKRQARYAKLSPSQKEASSSEAELTSGEIRRAEFKRQAAHMARATNKEEEHAGIARHVEKELTGGYVPQLEQALQRENHSITLPKGGVLLSRISPAQAMMIGNQMLIATGRLETDKPTVVVSQQEQKRENTR